MADPLLRVRDLSVDFVLGDGHWPALREISFDLAEGEVLGLVGESGSGKTTLLRVLAQDLPKAAVVQGGDVRMGEADLLRAPRAVMNRIRGRQLRFVHQDAAAAFTPTLRIGRLIAEPLIRHLGLTSDEAYHRGIEALRSCALPDPDRVVRLWPHQLSGGMRQRAMIAAAVAVNPRIILFDEPTSGLDTIVQRRVLDLVRQLSREIGGAAVFVTHDVGAVQQVADRVGVLYAGELVELGPAAEVLSCPQHPYTAALLQARPRIDRDVLPHAIPGGIARGADRFDTCVFMPRCALAGPPCATRPPRPQTALHWARCLRPGEIKRPDLTPHLRPPRDDAPVLEVEGLAVDYSGSASRRFRAVQDVSFTVRAGETFAIVGESGSGKTSVLRAVVGLVAPAEGRIRFCGRDIAGLRGTALRDYRRALRMVQQDSRAALNPCHTVGAAIGRPLALSGAAPVEVTRETDRMLVAVGLDPGFARRRPAELSGGECQRVGLAAAFLGHPRLVLLDEPTSALDVSVQAQILQLIIALQRRTGAAVLVISHDLAVVRTLADRMVVLRSGRSMESGTTEAVIGRPQTEYAQSLIAASASSFA
jgi:peptide/nickel transport system ATP-binding protein